jgi:glycosyltransferase involved in cell wall biosynthesis
MVSVLILTLNEESNLPACLESVKWSDDVLVLDSFSTDKTVEIARAAGARVMQNRFVNFSEQRNFGVQKGGLKHEWILHLDADEVVTAELKDELLRRIQTEDREAYRVPSKMIFEGRWLKYSGMYPTYQVRLGRREKLKFVQVGHGQRESMRADRLGTLRNALLHYSFAKGISDWVARHNRYSTDEARHFVDDLAGKELDWMGLCSSNDVVRRRRTVKQIAFHLPCRPALRFIYMYCLRLGFLDGTPGLHYCRLLAFYEYLVTLKIQELRGKAVQ